MAFLYFIYLWFSSNLLLFSFIPKGYKISSYDGLFNVVLVIFGAEFILIIWILVLCFLNGMSWAISQVIL